jgi:uncharacterized Zn finger protein (UPF0148 family)
VIPVARLLTLKCDNCGAPLPKQTTSGEMTCAHCGFRFKVVPPAPPPPAQPDPAAVQRAANQMIRQQHLQAMEVARRSQKVGGRIGAVVTFAIIATVASVVWFNVKKKGGFGVSMDYLLWDENGGRPVITSVNGREAVLGRVRTPGAGDKLFIRLSGTDGSEIWRTAPLSTYTEGYQSTFFAAAGDHAVYSDYRSQLYIVDLATGKDSRLISLTDRVKDLCSVDRTHVWLRQADERELMVDVTTATTMQARRPSVCRERDPWGHYADEDPGRAPKVAGFKADRVAVGDGVGVAAGSKSPGTPLPMLVGFDPAKGEVRWKGPLSGIDQNKLRDNSAEFGALHGDRYVATYGEGSELWHLTSIEARTGVRQWDVVLRNIFAVDWIRGIIVTDGYVYVTRTSSLEIFDAKNGSLTGTIGRETYE